MKTTEISTSYVCHSGFIVNKNEQLKTVLINNDNTFSVLFGGRHVNLFDIGLNNMCINTVNDSKIVFNTIKQCKVCCGKLVQSKLNGNINSLVQEWSKSGDENSLELRLSSNKCMGAVSFTSKTPVCTVCKRQDQKTTVKQNVITVQPNIEVDKEALLKSLFPGANELMLKILKTQSDICNNSGKDPRSRRWDKDIIQVCLTLWNRSPQAYASLMSSEMLFLPSINLLQRYKNCFSQSPGLNDNMLKWMYQEAKRMNIDMRGGLILDEMSIQDDLKMCFAEGKTLVDGLVEIGEFAHDLYVLNTHKNELRLASHVMQFLFLSYDGFRFPFAYFPTAGANVPELYITVWEAISKLSSYEFETNYVCLDGASNNRAFQMMHFKDKAAAIRSNFSASSPFGSTEKVTLIMDYSHNIKKVRNNLHASGDHECCKRKLQLDGSSIVWNHWISAFNWDKLHNPVRIHPKLTNEHIFLSKTSKMRNHLAEDVLNTDMLYLFKKYKESLKNAEHLNKTIELLELTSKVIELFRDRRPIADLSDSRLDCLEQFEQWLDSWADSIQNITDKSASEKAKMFISRETYSDVVSMCRGFLDICRKRINQHKRSVVPAGLNSDVIENFFCQQRTICHGSNTNPTIHQYKYGINATILGQNAVSKKSNAASKRKSIQPFKFSNPEPLHKKKTKIIL